MISETFHRLGVRLDALGSAISKLNPGPHRALRSFRRNRPSPLTPEAMRLIDSYLINFKDRGEPERAWREEGAIIPTAGDGHFEAVQRWRFIFNLIGCATPNGRNRISTKASLGLAMQGAGISDGYVNRFLATYPKLHDEPMTNVVTRLANHKNRLRFDLTPIVYGLLYPEADDIEEIKYTITRDFWIPPGRRHDPQDAASIASIFEAQGTTDS